MRLSVVIPTFNTAAMTLRCCRAIDRGEVVVADDGSTDGTAELLARELPQVRVLRLETNGGFAVAANRGVAAARGDLILLLNSDAVVEAGALDALLQAFEHDPKLGVAGARLLDEDGTAQWSGGRTPTLLWMAAAISGLGRHARRFRRAGTKPSSDEVEWVSGAAMMFRAEVWRAAGPLSERYRFYCQDLEFCLRARDAGWRVRIVEEARVTHSLGRTIAAGQPRRQNVAALRDDLLAWGTARYGRAWGFVARLVLTAIRRT